MVSINRSLFPHLTDGDFEETSAPDEQYNCLAWAAGIQDEWWEPSIDGVWPDDLPQEDTVECLVKVYERHGFTECADSSFEPGIEKIAIYGNGDGYEHAARQMDGKWTSKMGAGIDILHKDLDCLAGDFYGSVKRYMARPLTG